MRLGVLGPLLVLDDAGTALPVTAGKQRVLLAALAVRANRIVPVDELVDLVWDGVPPRGAVRAVRVYVVRLRQVLGAEVAARIVTRDPGYLLQADRNEIDVLQFDHLCHESGEAARVGAWHRAADLLADALLLWRGVPLLDVPSDTLRERELPRLTRLYEQAVERRIDTDLHLGRHEHVVAELRDLITRHPLREHLYAQLMLALAGMGDQAEALNVYQHARRRLVDELGVEPGLELRQLHEHILAGDVVLTESAQPGPNASLMPRMLPAAVTHFIGRSSELTELSELLEAAEPGGTAVISAIDGTAGVGKTALALQWAHRHVDQFPDGQLYVNLRGYDPDRPVSAADALAGFLRALGVAEPAIPAKTDERAARYRSLLAGRRMLVVVDNASAVAQVRPLLPGTQTCVTLVTSRDSLAGLVARDGARRVDLDVLSDDDAVGLLRALIGERVAADPGAALALATRCARLPLALRVAAERAVSRPAVPLPDLAGELADQQRRLDILDAGGDPHTAVRAVLSWSYQHLAADAARAFRLVSLHPGVELDAYAAAALIDTDLPQARRLLSGLAQAHLIQPICSDRYTMHDLLRAYGHELAATHEDEPSQRSALTHLFDHYLHTATTAMDVLAPAEQSHRPDIQLPVAPIPPMTNKPTEALGWLDTERANLVAMAAYTATHGWPRHTTHLAATLYRYLDRGGHYLDAITIHTHARHAADRTKDPAARATALTRLGAVVFRLGRINQAADYHGQALTQFRKIGDSCGAARALGNLAVLDIHEGHYHQAEDRLQQVLALFRTIGSNAEVARTLGNLGHVHIQLGRYHKAADYLEQALTLSRELNDRYTEGTTLDNLGDVNCRLGRYRQADSHYQKALVIFRHIGDRTGEALVLTGLADVNRRLGNYQQAEHQIHQALGLFREVNAPSGEARARNSLGELLNITGRPNEARTQHTTALDLASQIGDQYQQARAHNGLAHVHHTDGDPARARHHWQQALALYSAVGTTEADQIRAQLAHPLP